MNIKDRKAVIVISSHVVRGSVGNRAAVFALESLGFPVWALQTVTLPWHPGHGPSTRIVPDPEEFENVIDDLCNAPWLGEVAGVLTGYLGHATQASAVAKLIKAVKLKNPDLIYLCDPVIGDEAGLYVPDDTARAIKDELLPIANLATPNRFELAFLSGSAPKNNNDLLAACRALGPEMILTTSAFSLMRQSMANLLYSGEGNFLAEHRQVEKPPNGPGDLSAALMLAHKLGRQDAETILSKVTSSVFEILRGTRQLGGDELVLGKQISSLFQPNSLVQVRRLLEK